MNKKTFGVYIHQLKNGDIFYVGKGTESRSRNFRYRSKEYISFIEHCGTENIIIHFEKCQSEGQAFELEKFFIAYFKKQNHHLINKSSGGQGFSGCKLTKAHRLIISKTQKGKTLSKITRKKLVKV